MVNFWGSQNKGKATKSNSKKLSKLPGFNFGLNPPKTNNNSNNKIKVNPMFNFGIKLKPMEKKNMNWDQAKARFPKLNPFGDADKDGVKNWLDCKPFDIKRQDDKTEEYFLGPDPRKHKDYKRLKGKKDLRPTVIVGRIMPGHKKRKTTITRVEDDSGVEVSFEAENYKRNGLMSPNHPWNVETTYMQKEAKNKKEITGKEKDWERGALNPNWKEGINYREKVAKDMNWTHAGIFDMYKNSLYDNGKLKPKYKKRQEEIYGKSKSKPQAKIGDMVSIIRGAGDIGIIRKKTKGGYIIDNNVNEYEIKDKEIDYDDSIFGKDDDYISSKKDAEKYAKNFTQEVTIKSEIKRLKEKDKDFNEREGDPLLFEEIIDRDNKVAILKNKLSENKYDGEKDDEAYEKLSPRKKAAVEEGIEEYDPYDDEGFEDPRDEPSTPEPKDDARYLEFKDDKFEDD